MEDTNSDQVDSTLPPEWVLPELPHHLTPSLSTAEFEEIFGGSDEEGNFPLSVGGLQGHMELDNVLPNPNELFAIPAPLNIESKPPAEEKMEIDNKKTVNDSPVKQTTVTDNRRDSKENVPSSSYELVAPSAQDSKVILEAVQSTVGDDNVVGESEVAGASGRRSARLRAKEEGLVVGENMTIKSEKEDIIDEESLVDSLLEKNNEIFQQNDSSEDPPNQGQDNATAQQNVDDMLSNEDEDEDSDDPDKLWCICQQPHNDRFMICCDSCGEWYHGECVGISVAEGKRMEKTGQEYVCSTCVANEKEIKVEREKNRSLRLAKREQQRVKQIAELRGKFSGLDPNDELYVPETDEERALFKAKKRKLKIRDLVRKPCLGPGCEKEAVRPCLYCCDQCIERHCEFSIKKLSVRGLMPRKGQGVTLYEPSTKKMLTGLTAPGEKDLLQFIKEHKSFKVFVPSQKVLPAAKKPVKKSRRESEDQVPDSTNKTSLDAVAIRGHAQKALRQVLMARCQSASGSVDKSENQIAELAKDIELKLYNLYNQDVTQKYRSKCRSLLFNLKDTKNQVLFKRLVSGDLTTKQLVRMTPDQLASEELAEWREKTIKKELDMIKEVAIEEAQLSSSGVIRKMTYKGEIEIERQSEVETTEANEKADEVTSTTPELATPSITVPPLTTPTIIRPKTEPKPAAKSNVTSLLLTDLLTDTTSQHGSHVFDHNCDICLGKKIDSTKQPTATTPKELPSPDSRTMDSELVVTEVTSPDPITTPSPYSPSYPSPLVPVWSGSVSMHGLETTSVLGYPVSGPIDTIDIQQVFPDSLLIVGRIAHVQVWDYIDKLHSSLTKEIAVLRFDRTAEDSNSYLDMMDYFIHKHRYGVIQCTNISGVKDMYMIPLQYDDPLPPQLLPFTGPGLPTNRRDMFLCIITKLKSQPQPPHDIPRKRKHSGKVHFSSDTPPSDTPKKKKSRPQVVIGFGEGTPPLINAPPDQSPQDDVDVVKHKPFFYRETEFKEEPVAIAKEEESIVKMEEDNVGKSSPLVSNPGIKSILSTLSDEKIKELASVAMSALGGGSGQVVDVKKDIPAPAQSTSLMKGTIPQYSISTVELSGKGSSDHYNNQSQDPSDHALSLDDRIKATFGGPTDRSRVAPPISGSGTHPNLPPSHPPYGVNQSNTHSHSNSYPHSHSVYQHRQTHSDYPAQSAPPRDQYAPPSGGYTTYQGDDRGYRQPHPPYGHHQAQSTNRYPDYRPGGGPEGYGPPERGRYDYPAGRGDNHYRHRGFGERDRGDEGPYHNREWRERESRPHNWDRNTRNDDYGQ